MKKLSALFFYALLCSTVCVSCLHRGGGYTDISISETHHYYSMDATFNKNRTRDIDEYMDSKIGRRSNMSFVNSRIDGTITLDDHTTFYIKKFAGELEIKLNKDENSDQAYERIKSMCDGIKKLLVK